MFYWCACIVGGWVSWPQAAWRMRLKTDRGGSLMSCVMHCCSGKRRFLLAKGIHGVSTISPASPDANVGIQMHCVTSTGLHLPSNTPLIMWFACSNPLVFLFWPQVKMESLSCVYRLKSKWLLLPSSLPYETPTYLRGREKDMVERRTKFIK